MAETAAETTRKIFEKVFAEAELAKLTPEEIRTYEESLKVYRDNYNVLETVKNEGRQEGASEKAMEIAQELKRNGVAIDLIAQSTGLSKAQIEKL